MSKFVGYGERGTQSIIFNDRTAPIRIAHGPQFGQSYKKDVMSRQNNSSLNFRLTQCIAFPRGSTYIVSRKIKKNYASSTVISDLLLFCVQEKEITPQLIRWLAECPSASRPLGKSAPSLTLCYKAAIIASIKSVGADKTNRCLT